MTIHYGIWYLAWSSSWPFNHVLVATFNIQIFDIYIFLIESNTINLLDPCTFSTDTWVLSFCFTWVAKWMLKIIR